MIMEALEWIRQHADPVITENSAGERVYIDHKGCANLLPIRKPNLAEPLALTSLQGLVDYVKDVADDGDLIGVEDPFIHVVSASKVELISSLDEHRRRERIVSAWAIVPVVQLEREMVAEFKVVQAEQEEFIMKMQAALVDDDERARLLLATGTIKGEEVITAVDDGATQVVDASKGTKTGKVPIENPFNLAPYRTFPEIEQPKSPFICRLHYRKGDLPLISLVSTGCVKWQSEAVESIKAWLQAQDIGLPIIG